MPKMIFSDLYKSPRSAFSKLRISSHSESQQPQNAQTSQNSHNAQQSPHSSQHPHLSGAALAAELEYGDAELVSQNKAKQKEAVRRFLTAHVRHDWSFEGPVQTTATAAAEIARAKELLADEPKEPPSEEGEGSTASAARTVPLSAITAAMSSGSGNGSGSGSTEDLDSDDDSDGESDYSTVSEDPAHFRPRAEWTSDVSDEDDFGASIISATHSPLLYTPLYSPFRFDSPDSVGKTVKATSLARRTKIRRDLRAEMAWNTGLACFTARRDAWTGAHTVRVKPKESLTTTSPRRGLFRFHSRAESTPAPATSTHTLTRAITAPAMTTTTTTTATATTAPTATAHAAATTATPSTAPLSPVMSNSRQSQNSQNSQNSRNSQSAGGPDTVETSPMTSDGGGGREGCQSPTSGFWPLAQVPTHRQRRAHGKPRTEYAVETMLPVARPLLPPANPMRSSITPNLYLSLYDKVVLSSLQPSCPVNLADAVRACVCGWKRDGEWPPRPDVMSMSARRKREQDRKEREQREKEKEREKEQREKEKEKEKERRNSMASRRNSSSLSSPGFGRRMSHLLSGGRPAAASLTTNVAAGMSGGAGGLASAASDGSSDGAGRGIRRSLQRVLGLGHGSQGVAAAKE